MIGKATPRKMRGLVTCLGECFKLSLVHCSFKEKMLSNGDD